MVPKSFQDLINIRKRWVQSSKENNFDFDSILAGIYNDPSHFIYEILQNAEDAKADEISFKLLESRLEIKHNGKDFIFNDVNGITGIGISTKKEDINAIGKFGVGFKSVFAITKTPIIHSGTFHFKIEEFVIPVEINSDNGENTLIILPFNHPKRNKKEVFEIINKKLERLELKTLLFLKNIKQIDWVTPSNYGHYHKVTRKIKSYTNVFKTIIQSETNHDKTEEKFLVLSRPIFINSQYLKVEIAYRIAVNEKKKENIVEEKDSKLIVFFPTEKVTFLNFLIHGPYKTTPNRENIPLDDPQNQFLISETANLIAESIKIIKELKLLNISFLEVLPIDPNHLDEIIYSSFFKKIKKVLSSKEEFLPTSSKNFTNSRNTLLARGKELTDMLNETDIKILFNKRTWLDNNITYDRTRQLHDYLTNELEIKEVDFENFAVAINIKFIKQKSDEWLVEFYSRLLNQRSLWEEDSYYSRNEGVLRRKPIIRLSDNKHLEPFDMDDKIQVYLPSESKSKYKTVKRLLSENKKSLKFLIELGLSVPDLFAEIKEFIIPKYSKDSISVPLKEYFDDFEKLLAAYNKADTDKKRSMMVEFSKLFIIYSKKSQSNKNFLVKPLNVYLPSQELTEYFDGYENVYFVSQEIQKRFPEAQSFIRNFLVELGCEDKPRRTSIDSILTYEEKGLLRKRNHQSNISYENHTNDYDLKGLDSFLKVITRERSIILWNFLLTSLATSDNWDKREFFYGEYSWFYYSNHVQKFESKFLKTLKNTPWLFDKSENVCSPREISLSTLSEDYDRDKEDVQILIDTLDFQTDDIKKLEEKTGKKVILLDPFEEQEFLKWKQEQNKNNEGEDDTGNSWIPEVDPENIEISVEILDPDIIETTDLRGQHPNDSQEVENIGEKENNSQFEHKEMMSKTQLKDIGDWGERFVFKHLKEKYGENIHIKILWLNNDKNVGIGYDFSIVRNGKEIEYIEVKSRIDGTPQLIEITGTQWEFARKLYNEDDGDKYKIYIVSDTGNRKAKIRIISNPVKLWKEGRLYAHPVQIKL